MEYKWMHPDTDWMKEEILYYQLPCDLSKYGEIVTNEIIAESPELYDMEKAVQVEHVAIADNYESDFYRMPDGCIAITDTCGIIVQIEDDLKSAAEWIGCDALPIVDNVKF